MVVVSAGRGVKAAQPARTRKRFETLPQVAGTGRQGMPAAVASTLFAIESKYSIPYEAVAQSNRAALSRFSVTASAATSLSISRLYVAQRIRGGLSTGFVLRHASSAIVKPTAPAAIASFGDR
jgi:hypothetical protein